VLLTTVFYSKENNYFYSYKLMDFSIMCKIVDVTKFKILSPVLNIRKSLLFRFIELLMYLVYNINQIY
jgi:hypothetical protein